MTYQPYKSWDGGSIVTPFDDGCPRLLAEIYGDGFRMIRWIVLDDLLKVRGLNDS